LTAQRPGAQDVDMSTLQATVDRQAACPWNVEGGLAPDLALDDYPSTMLMRLAQGIQTEISATYARAHGLSVSEWRMLARLNAQGAMQLGEFCRALAMDKAYVSRLIRSLQPRGLIVVHADPAHGRRLILDITAKGRALARRVLPQARAAQHALLQVLEPDERAGLYRALRKLQAALAAGSLASRAARPTTSSRKDSP
jgi:DNA-binding MarR family transcriptional regulator